MAGDEFQCSLIVLTHKNLLNPTVGLFLLVVPIISRLIIFLAKLPGNPDKPRLDSASRAAMSSPAQEACALALSSV